MGKEERVVVVVSPLEYKVRADETAVALRIRALGLTAYGKDVNEAKRKLRLMFGTFVELHRQSGTLERRLNKSGLRWCRENEYSGHHPAEVVTKDGSIELIHPLPLESSDDASAWQGTKEMVVAH